MDKLFVLLFENLFNALYFADHRIIATPQIYLISDLLLELRKFC